MIYGLTGRQAQGPVSPSAQSTKPTSTSSEKGAKSTAKKGEKTRRLACDEIADQLRHFVVNSTGSAGRLPESCYEPDQMPTSGDYLRAFLAVKFAIATVANPVATHLSLLFDRSIESIQQAAQDDGYSYEGSWFPWDFSRKDYSSLHDQLEANRLQQVQQAQPGIMVFRGQFGDDNKADSKEAGGENPYERGLVIFLVGEQPTGGLSDDQFDNASAWIHQLSQDRQSKLLILGTTFSGSLPSLQLALQRNVGEPCPSNKTSAPLCAYARQKRITVSSGTVSSDRSYHHFRNWMESSRNGFFRTAYENDTLMTDRFCDYLDKQRYPRDRVAELSEDETAFGTFAPETGPSKNSSDSCPALSFYYPRDIASLRSAYEQQSIFNAAAPQANPETPSTRLRGTLSEPSGSDNDSVRHYGGTLTPIRQESILAEITRQLSERRIQFIIVRSTNSLDQIFLSEFLRRYYPEGRLVIEGADLMFTEGSWGGLLRGVMVLSPYPLLTLEPLWTSSLLCPPTGGYRTFGLDLSEGTYIAARELFRDPANPVTVPIHDYSPPAWARDPDVGQSQNDLPATWLTVIGHRRFWPVAALNEYTLRDDKESGAGEKHTASEVEHPTILPPPLERGDGLPFDCGDAQLPLFPTVMWVVLVACVLWAAVHFWFCAFPSIVRKPHARAYFAPLSQWEHPVLIAFGSLLMANLAVTVAGASGWFSWRGGSISYEWLPGEWLSTGTALSCWIGVVLSASLSGVLMNYRLVPLAASPVSKRDIFLRRAFALVMGTAFFALVLWTHLYLARGLTHANAIPTYWRNVNLLSGVSGLLPQLLPLAAIYVWFWCRLRSLAHRGEDRPLLPLENDLPPQMPAFSREAAAEPVEGAAGLLGWRYLATLGAATVFTFLICWVALGDRTVRTLGERRFGTFIFCWACVFIAVILADALQFWRVWGRLRLLLIRLDRLPLRRTLRALKGLEWGSLWKVSGNVLEERYRVMTLQVESIRHLKNTLALKPASDPFEEERIRAVIVKIDQCLNGLYALAEWYVDLQRKGKAKDQGPVRVFQAELAATAGLVMMNILQPAWQSETESLIFARSRAEESSGESGGEEVKSLAGSVPPHVRAAEEFFVLPYVAFIQNTLGQMRSIVLGTLWLFVGITLAFSSYPFQPLETLGLIFLAIFLLAGGATVVVYAQMCRNATLSHITDRTPGQLGWDFWSKLAGFGIGPVVGLLTTLFPSITDFVFSWFQPGTDVLK